MRQVERAALTVLAICFSLAAVGRGSSDTFSVFLLPISADFGWSRADVVSIYSVAALSGGVASPLVGRLFDLSGARAVYSLGLILVGGGFLLASTAQSLWQLQLCIGVAVGFGGVCFGTITGSLLLGRWFGPRLPTAVAIVSAATGVGTFAWVPFSQLLIEHYGWRGAYQGLGAGLLTLLLPLVLLPWKRFSEGSDTVLQRRAAATNGDWSLVSAIGHHAFWALFATYFFTAVGVFCVTVQVIAYLVAVGFQPLHAATAWGFSGILLAIGMLSISMLDGWLGRRRAILFSYSLSTIGLVMLLLLQRWPTVWLLAGFLVCFGSTIGSRGPLISATAIRIFSGQRVGTIFGAISLGSGLGSALGSWTGGLILDWTGSYDLVILFALANVLTGMAPFLIVPALRQ
jgi:predicted MFS family arabinose efflux permease